MFTSVQSTTVLRAPRAIWAHRNFISALVKREFMTKYANSSLGAAWSVISPLVMMSMYALVFSQVMEVKLSSAVSGWGYVMHLFTGLLLWTLFSDVLMRTQSMFPDYSNFLKKMKIHIGVVPVVVVLNVLVSWGIMAVLFFLFLTLGGYLGQVSFLHLGMAIFVVAVLAVGTGLILSTLNVFFRDIGQLVPVLLNVGFWATPIVYPPSVLPGWALNILQHSPVFQLVDFAQNSVVAGGSASTNAIFIPLVWAIVAFVFGCLVLGRAKTDLVDQL
ncbi:ABC transporter permease [Limnobacter parvus]|uniref:Transport permease protein n=1 Tax=Limnobacter parvus TaxID=2939690 RepID=A0ABT1XG07_9BURK|nr:ABC transporter permease [Limnobacter parvus]MCR2745232.1 ABC transporter permease [Limnobacter parvus]